MRNTLMLIIVISLFLLSGCSAPDIISNFSDSSEGNSAKNIEDLVEQNEVKAYQMYTVSDATLGIEAARVLIPADWEGAGGVDWSGQSQNYPATITMGATAPDNVANFMFRSGASYKDPIKNSEKYSEFAMSTEATQLLRFKNASEYPRFLIKKLSSKKTLDFNTLSSSGPTGQLKEDIATLKVASEKEIDVYRNMFAQYTSLGKFSISPVKIEAKEVEFTFREGEKKIKAKSVCIVRSNTVTHKNPLYTTKAKTWEVFGTAIFTALESEYDSFIGDFDTFLSNVVYNEQWKQTVAEATAYVQQQYADQQNKNVQALTQSIQQSAQQRLSYTTPSPSYSSGADSASRILNGWNNTINQKSNWETPDGGSVNLSSADNYAYTDGSNYYTSNSPLSTSGSGLTEMNSLPSVGD